MRRQALYSRSGKPDQVITPAPAVVEVTPSAWWRIKTLQKHLRLNNLTLLWSMLGLLALMLALSLFSSRPGERKLTQEDINAAVLKTLETTQLPSAAAKAYETIIPSVVRVVGYSKRRWRM